MRIVNPSRKRLRPFKTITSRVDLPDPERFKTRRRIIEAQALWASRNLSRADAVSLVVRHRTFLRSTSAVTVFSLFEQAGREQQCGAIEHLLGVDASVQVRHLPLALAALLTDIHENY